VRASPGGYTSIGGSWRRSCAAPRSLGGERIPACHVACIQEATRRATPPSSSDHRYGNGVPWGLATTGLDRLRAFRSDLRPPREHSIRAFVLRSQNETARHDKQTGGPPNNEMNLTKPAQAMELRRLSQCSTDMRSSDEWLLNQGNGLVVAEIRAGAPSERRRPRVMPRPAAPLPRLARVGASCPLHVLEDGVGSGRTSPRSSSKEPWTRVRRERLPLGERRASRQWRLGGWPGRSQFGPQGP